MNVLSEVQRLVSGYYWTWTLVDHRVDGWFLMSSGKPIIFFITIYLLFVHYGPQLMIKRKAFHLKWILFVYNLFVAILNLYICVELFMLTSRHGYGLLCEPVHTSTDPENMRILVALDWYFKSKLIEFLDTVFIILRKKFSQLSFLHVYHHSTMFFFTFIGIRWVPGGSAVIGAAMNSFVHVLMYGYYGLCVLGPSVTKYLWWKRYLTMLQLVQFVIGLSIGVYGCIYYCPFPRWMHYTNFFYMLSYIFLFVRFYLAAYIDKKSKCGKKN